MSDIVITITDAGRAALVNAANTGTAPVTVSACGVSATAVAPDVAADELPDEIKRIATLSGDVVADDTIHLIVRDESADVYAVRSLALYLDDGTLFAIYGQAGAIMEKSAQAMLLLTLDIRFADIAAAALTFGDTNFLNPPATTERQGVVELATEAESATGTDAARAVTPKGLKAAVAGWLDARFGAGAPSVWVKSILGAANAAALRIALALDKVNNTPDADKPVSTPQQAALDAKADKARTIVAGNGLIGGGTLEANRTVGMGTPATVTAATQNAVTATSHTHALNLAKGDLGLGNVDNTADAAKPVSTAQASAIAAATAAPALLARLLTVDGSGSGLDADLLRGLTPDQVVSLARVLAALGYTPANAAGQIFSGDVKVSREGANARLLVENKTSGKRASLAMQTDDNLVLYLSEADGDHPIFSVRSAAGPLNFGVPLMVSGSLVWHSGNDGSGSGLDGDLWRGLDPAGFFAAYFPSGSNANGWWRKFPDGTIEQRGRVATSGTENAYEVTFPIPFTDASSIAISLTGKFRSVDDDMWPMYQGEPTLTGMTVRQQGTTSGELSNGFSFIVVGK